MSRQDELLSLLNCDNLNESETLNIIKKMKNIQKLKDKYKDKIKKRKDGKQYYIYINRKQICGKTEDELYEKLYNLEFGTEQYSMCDIFPLWLRWKRDYTAVSGKTLQIYSQDWKKWFEKEEISKKPIKNLIPKEFIDLFRKWTCKRTITSKKFNNLKTLVNGMYAYAINELQIVKINPIREIDMRQFPMKPENNENKAFNLDERKEILQYFEKHKMYGIDEMYALAIQFDFYVTLRIGELKSLKWENYRNNQIYVDSQYVLTTELQDDGTFQKGEYKNVDHVKGNSQQGFRWIPLPTKAQEILEKVKALNPDGEYIFMYQGKQMYTQTFNEHLEKYCKEIGIESKSSHNIRFTVASVLYQGGVPLTEIQRLLGHTQLSMTLHYLKQILPSLETANLIEKCLA